MNRAIAFLMSAMLGVISAYAFWPTTRTGSVMHAGLKLGMPKADALTSMRKLDPGAIDGRLCHGGDGVAAIVQHLKMSWLFMALAPKGTVIEISFYADSPAVTDDWRQCEAQFQATVLDHYAKKYPDITWSRDHYTTTEDVAWTDVSGRLPDGTPLSLVVWRPNGHGERCNMRIIYNRASLEDRSASKREQLL